ncbi:MAG: hypothetical protein IJN03_00305 [Bacilli bacterium]|nr:hypothetical protein [Bacilli bacterium]
MDYCHDILINMEEDNVFKFYEWENYDPIELIKKIPIFRVNSKTLHDFYLYDVLVSLTFLESLKDKTILKNNKLNKTLKYACLLCDCKNVLVVEFNDSGKIIGRSNLLLDDEANIIEFIYNYKESKMLYQKEDKIKITNSLRQEEMIKKVIRLELKTVADKKNASKLKYLFNELFGYEENNINKIKELIEAELKLGININLKKIYDLIVLSYNN